MQLLEDDILFRASAPGQVLGTTAQTVGPPGLRTAYYWWVTHFPIGATITGPIMIRNAPDAPNVTNYVNVTGTPTLGALTYDLLRTDIPVFPSVIGNFAIATGLAVPTFRDIGAPPALYDPTGLPFGAPVSGNIILNNRDFKQPTFVITPWQLSVVQLIFPDGSTQSTAAGGGGGGVNGPPVTTVGFIPVWSNSTGTLLGVGFPASSVSTGSGSVVLTNASGTIDSSFIPQLFSWSQNVNANGHNLLGLNCLQLLNPTTGSLPIYQCVDTSGTLQISTAGTLASTVDFVTQRGRIAIGTQLDLRLGRLEIYMPALEPDPTISMIYALNTLADCKMDVENDAGNIWNWGVKISTNANFGGYFFISGGVTIPSTDWMLSPQRDCSLGLDAGNISNRVPARMLIMIPTLYTGPVGIDMLALVNQDADCRLSINCAFTGGQSILVLHNTVGTQTVSIDPLGNLMISTDGTVANGRVWITPSGQVGIGIQTPVAGNQLQVNSTANVQALLSTTAGIATLEMQNSVSAWSIAANGSAFRLTYVTASRLWLLVSPFGIFTINTLIGTSTAILNIGTTGGAYAATQDASITCQTSSATTWTFGAKSDASTDGAPFTSSYFVSNTASGGGYREVITAAGDVLFGLQPGNVSEFATGRVQIYIPPGYATPGVAMLFALNSTNDCFAILHGSNALAQTYLTLQGDVRTYSIVTTGSSLTPAECFLLVDRTFGANRVFVTPNGDVGLGTGITAGVDTVDLKPARLQVYMPSAAPNGSIPMIYAFNAANNAIVTIESSFGPSVNLVATGLRTFSLLGGNQFSIVDVTASNAARFSISQTGFVGIGIAGPAHFFQVAVDDAAKPTTNTWTITSDVRTKRNVRPLAGGLDVIKALEPIEAEYNGCADTPEGSRVVSFDPRALAAVLPGAVSSVRRKLAPDDLAETDVLGVNTHEILHHLVLAVKQLSAQLEARN